MQIKEKAKIQQQLETLKLKDHEKDKDSLKDITTKN